MKWHAMALRYEHFSICPIDKRRTPWMVLIRPIGQSPLFVVRYCATEWAASWLAKSLLNGTAPRSLQAQVNAIASRYTPFTSPEFR